MKTLWKLWDTKLRTGFIVLFVGFLLLLIVKHNAEEIRYQESVIKLEIQDSVSFKLANGMTMTIYKKETDESTDNNSTVPGTGNNQ